MTLLFVVRVCVVIYAIFIIYTTEIYQNEDLVNVSAAMVQQGDEANQFFIIKSRTTVVIPKHEISSSQLNSKTGSDASEKVDNDDDNDNDDNNSNSGKHTRSRKQLDSSELKVMTYEEGDYFDDIENDRASGNKGLSYTLGKIHPSFVDNWRSVSLVFTHR